MNNQRGFSLIELLLVIAIILTVSILSVGFYARFINQNNIEVAANETTAQLRKAQLYTQLGRQNSLWGVHYASNVLTLFAGNSYATRNTAFDENFTFPSSMSISGWNDVVFQAVTGTPSATLTTTFAGNGSDEIVTVNAQGTVDHQ